jgi:hypothetical protein
VLARVQSQARMLGVVLGRGGQYDRVHIVGRQSLVQILAQARVRRQGVDPFAARIRGVANQSQLRPLAASKGAHVVDAPGSGSDDGNANHDVSQR